MEFAWSELHFPNLNEHYGIAVALFPGTYTIESIFFVLHRGKDVFRLALRDFGLEGVIYANEAICHETTTSLIIERSKMSNLSTAYINLPYHD